MGLLHGITLNSHKRDCLLPYGEWLFPCRTEAYIQQQSATHNNHRSKHGPKRKHGTVSEAVLEQAIHTSRAGDEGTSTALLKQQLGAVQQGPKDRGASWLW